VRPEWHSLLERLEVRLIRILDIFSIMVSDLVVIGIGYTVIRVAGLLSNGDSKFFEVAKTISEGVFLLLYVIMVLVDCWEFIKRESRERASAEVR